MFARLRLVRAVLSARKRGMRAPTYVEFAARQRERSWLTRIRETCGDLEAVFYWMAAVEVGRGRRWRGALWLAGAFALVPSYVLTRLSAQVLRNGWWQDSGGA
jgi:hypothetical protein